LRFPGAGPVRGLPALERALRSGSRIVHWVPLTGDRKELEEAAMLVWRTPGPYLWWIDELAEVCTANWVPRGIKLCNQQGRQPEKGMLSLTQRVSETHPVCRSQAESIFVFADRPIDVDCKALAGHVGLSAAELEAALADLAAKYGRHAHLWYLRQTQEHRYCMPIPLHTGRARMPRRPPATDGAPVPQ
jgi:hypothetical protein